MCGIVGAVAKQDVLSFLLDGLKRLEYRGYDSAGVAVLSTEGTLQRTRALGKVSNLESLLLKSPIQGPIGIGHTRWATHGAPSERNAHPHVAADRVIVVHNGIVENYQSLKASLQKEGYEFLSDTDTEVVAACIAHELKNTTDLLAAVQNTVRQLKGAYALGILDKHNPSTLIGVRSGSPLVIGIGKQGHFLASDPLALQSVTQSFIYLEHGDIAKLTTDAVTIVNEEGTLAERKVQTRQFESTAATKGSYPHFMLKEIFEQPMAFRDTLEGGLEGNQIIESAFGVKAAAHFDQVKQVHIIACGTSYHAGMIARLWLEEFNIPCQVEIASEFRYRKRAILPNTLLVFISQSGETADTLAALRSAQTESSVTLSICNVAHSSLVRESELMFITQAGPEIGVCSTKAFTTQLGALFLLALTLGHRQGLKTPAQEALIQTLWELPSKMEALLAMAPAIKAIAPLLKDKTSALFLGRGLQFPIALEGALKLKEISYIHAEAYPAGELKHGPLALVDEAMPVIVMAPLDDRLGKLKSNIEEIKARGGKLIILAPLSAGIQPSGSVNVILLPEVNEPLSPIVYTIALQLLAYEVALLRGADVDQPRNLAKSVTVE